MFVIVPRDGCVDYANELHREVRPNGGDGPLPKIFAFCNGCHDRDWHNITRGAGQLWISGRGCFSC